jgi:hypothetical protein
MNKNVRDLFWVATFLTILATAVLAVCFIFGIFYGAFKPEYGAAIGELLLVVVLAVGEAVALFGLKHIAKEREFQCWLKAQEIWTEQQFVKQRGKLFERLDSRNPDWTDQEVEEAKWVCRRMDEFVRLAPFLGTRTLLDTWDDPLAKAWLILKPIVKKEQMNVAHWSTKWDAFEKIGQKALDKLIREGRMPADQTTTK